ncbi:HHL057Wp [Eremothecium sinecaudum]|uniref:HHL057Wp n=1 Tax=Eremothecium sinecaudum TaxID=45286 RepID=A0A120K2V1_9SACH|nr:HHL057Wp [Eremothecium sinecaudum]AMD22713.1 HHL057Wp [Eremothecium sinecaudum]
MSGGGFLSTDITHLDHKLLELLPQAPNGHLFREAYLSSPWPNVKVEEQRCKIVERKLLFQVCMVEDISRSKLSQIDEFQMRLNPRKRMVDRVNYSKREVVTAIDVDTDEPQVKDSCSDVNRVYKLTLQDKIGQLFYAINIEHIATLKTCMLGAKVIVLPGTVFNRGMFMLTNANLRTLFGLIPSWNADKDRKICTYLESKLDDDREVLNGANGKRKR